MKRRRLTKSEEETCQIIYRAIDLVAHDSRISEEMRLRATGKLGRALWRALAVFAPKPSQGAR